MNRKRLAGCLVIVVLALGTTVLAVRLFFHSPINEANFERITKGMTRQDVEAILRGPPRNELPDGEIPWMFMMRGSSDRADYRYLWLTSRCCIEVAFDGDAATSHVQYAVFHEQRQMNWVDYLRYYLRGL